MKIYFLGFFTSKFCHASHRLTFLLALLYLFENYLGRSGIFMQIVIEFLLYKIAHKLCHRRSIGTHVARTEFGFSLRFKHRFFNLNRNRCNHSITNVGIFKIAIEVFFNCTRHHLFKRSEVSTSLSCVLTIHKRVIFLAILIGVSDYHLNILTRKVDGRI